MPRELPLGALFFCVSCFNICTPPIQRAAQRGKEDAPGSHQSGNWAGSRLTRRYPLVSDCMYSNIRLHCIASCLALGEFYDCHNTSTILLLYISLPLQHSVMSSECPARRFAPTLLITQPNRVN
ncbi:hypothetical protein GE09DRAFT_25188 [Coniochaeta sp. 2T2.1]|nr:hypothetical protein GE09DRAFT_25188 [Coniochaeta sp. 2T2.1]